MAKTFLIGDTHFGHSNIVKFTRKDGTFLRPWRNILDHDQALIENWNKVVQPCDKVYHLGDVGFKNATYIIMVLQSLNGTKVLIKGNHDVHKLSQYTQIFKDVRAYHQLNNIFLAHIPIHPDCLDRWRGQVHGHTHANSVMLRNWLDDPISPDKRYMNVSCEQINYTPIDFEKVNEYFK